MSSLGSLGRNMYGFELGPIYHFKPKLDFGLRVIYKLDPKAGLKPSSFYGSEPLCSKKSDTHLHP